MSECCLSGRGQGHMSNFYIVDLENSTGDIHNSSMVGLFMTAYAGFLRRDLSIKRRFRAKSLAGDNQRQCAAAKKAGRSV